MEKSECNIDNKPVEKSTAVALYMVSKLQQDILHVVYIDKNTSIFYNK